MALLGTLEITLLEAQELANVEWIGQKQDPYAVLKIGKRSSRSNTHTDGGRNPKWCQCFTFPDVTSEDQLEIEIFDENTILKDVCIGAAKLPLRDVVSKGSQVQDARIPVYTKKLGKQKGYVMLRTVFRKGALPPTVVGVVTATGSIKNPIVEKLQPKKAWLPGDWVFETYKNTNCWKDYRAVREINLGLYGPIYEGQNKETEQRVTIKIIAKNRLATPEEVEDVRHEVQIMHHLEGHPNIVRLLNVYEDKQYVFLVQEHCAGGELFDAIVERGSYTERDAARIMRTILSVIEHCHAMGVIHRDLKPENFLLESKSFDATIKTAEFGRACFFQEGQKLKDLVGSAWYVAPEVIDHSYGKQADVWSCGVILYILLCGRPPFAGGNEQALFEQIRTKPLDMTSEPWPRISESAQDCVRRMLERDVTKRASAREILQHEWMREGTVAPSEPLQLEVVHRISTFSNMNRLKQEACKVIANNLPVEEIMGLREMFLEIDKDRSHTITVDEFTKAVRSKGQHMSQAEMARLIEAADLNGDGLLDYEEFLAVMLNHSKYKRDEHLRAAFNRFDKDGNGSISMEELSLALKEHHVSPAEIAAILCEADEDGDGEISWDEFQTMMRLLD